MMFLMLAVAVAAGQPSLHVCRVAKRKEPTVPFAVLIRPEGAASTYDPERILTISPPMFPSIRESRRRTVLRVPPYLGLGPHGELFSIPSDLGGTIEIVHGRRSTIRISHRRRAGAVPSVTYRGSCSTTIGPTAITDFSRLLGS